LKLNHYDIIKVIIIVTVIVIVLLLIINILIIVIVIDTNIALITNINITIDYKEYDGDRVVGRVARSLSLTGLCSQKGRTAGGGRLLFTIITHDLSILLLLSSLLQL